MNQLPNTFAEIKKLQSDMAKQLAIQKQQNAMQKVHLDQLNKVNREKELAGVTAFCERMVKEKKLAPHELLTVDAEGKRKPSKIEWLMALDDANRVLTFGEKKLTLREQAMKEIESRNPVSAFGEKMAHVPDLPAGPMAGVNLPAGMNRVQAALAMTEAGKAVLSQQAKKAGQSTTVDGRLVF
jgi:hypothetical protein